MQPSGAVTSVIVDKVELSRMAQLIRSGYWPGAVEKIERLHQIETLGSILLEPVPHVTILAKRFLNIEHAQLGITPC
jgi:hypothetical protein